METPFARFEKSIYFSSLHHLKLVCLESINLLHKTVESVKQKSSLISAQKFKDVHFHKH